MLYVIHGIDKPGGELRKSLIEDHRAYMHGQDIPVISSGPLLGDDGETMIGSLIIVEAEDRAAVEALVAGDPFYNAGVFERIEISAWWQRVGQFAAPDA